MLRLVTPPATPVVSLAEIKRHVRVENSDDDSYLESLVSAATGMVDGADGWLGRALITQTWDYALDLFPCQRSGSIAVLPIPLAPLVSVTSVAYTAADGTDTPLATFRTFNATSSQPAYIVPAIDETWPLTKCEPESVRIRFVAGYGAAGAVPAGIKHAIMLIAGHWYENREDVGDRALAKMPMASEALLMPYRNWRG
ncbi:head-tail connector protein [Mesorhizobium sp.]|uniref:head-tail connector protein n=1 Tax=Mesorhizobium sp. TaxID=1871066 RepID=UPI000FE75801|nr:head-tail connector protein [Mesorhizobium sp.]RWO20666.1 MAG: phage gp6-like head-tail connector protein [Mesorhizobium sp.]